MTIRFWNAQRTVNGTTSGAQDRPQIAQLADGTIVVAWADQGSGGNAAVRTQRFDARGTPLGNEQIVADAAAVFQRHCDIAALTTGGYVVTWVDETNNTFTARKYLADGTPDGGPIDLADPALAIADFAYHPPVVRSLPGGEFVVVYRTAANNGDLVGRVVNAAGVAQPAFAIATKIANDQFAPAVVVANGLIGVAWGSEITNKDVAVRFFDLAGNPLSSEMLANTNEGDDQTLPAMAALSNGTFVVTWWENTGPLPASGSEIHGRIVNSLGQVIGNQFTVNATTLGEQCISKVVPLADGKFLVVYGTSSGGPADTLRVQLFDPDGSRAGAELTLSTTAKSSHSIPDIVTLADGRVAVVWDDGAADGSSTGIAMRILDPRDGFFHGTADADTIYGHDGFVDYLEGDDGADAIYGLRGNDTLDGGSGADALMGGRGDDLLLGGADNDILLGDVGDDELFGDAGVDDMRGGAGADAFDGGAGTDIANFSAAAASLTVALDGSLAGTGDALGDTFINVEDIRGANIAGPGDILRGNSSANSLTGYAGDDSLNGRAGSDKLMGGIGTDTLAGEAGNDQFIYSATSEAGDVIVDFSSAASGNDDVFKFKGAAFGGLAAGTLAAANFISRADNLAQDADDFFIFRTTDKTLWFDANGATGGAANAILIADLQASATMTNLDISIF